MAVVEVVLEWVASATETKFHLNNQYEKQYYININENITEAVHLPQLSFISSLITTLFPLLQLVLSV